MSAFLYLSCRSKLLLLLLALASGGCTRAIVYGVASGAPAKPAEPIRLYFDRDGSLYPLPAAGIALDDEELAWRNGYLCEYFTSQVGHPQLAAQRLTQQNALWRYYTTPTAAAVGENSQNSACRWYYTLPVTAPNTLGLSNEVRKQKWRELQQLMRQRAAAEVTRQLDARHHSELVILVHGFNTKAASTHAWYDSVEADVRRRQPGRHPRFLEVYWDGGKAFSPLPLKLWGYAQHNMYGVGLALRQVLAGIPADSLLPTRIITHSTGGPLVCIALWNSVSALGSESAKDSLRFWDEAYRRLQQRYCTPRLPGLRIAMLAPAMPGAHFRQFLHRTPPSPGDSTGRCERLIFGQNRHDIATGKTILVSSKWSWIGATSLGVRPDEYCQFVRPRVDGKPYVQTRTYLLDFTGHGTPYHAHGVLEFRHNQGAYAELLHSWLDDAEPTAASPWLVKCR